MYYQHKHREVQKLKQITHILQGNYLTDLGYDILIFLLNHIIDNEN